MQSFCPTCGQALPWGCQWHLWTLTLYSELMTKDYSLPCSTIMWESLGTILTYIMSGTQEALKVGWTGTVSVMQVHHSAGPSREPASGRTADWEPLAVTFFLRLRFLWLLPVTKHGGDTRTQPFLSDARSLSRLPLPGHSPSACLSHPQNRRAIWSSFYPSLLPSHSLFPVIPASWSEGTPLSRFLPLLSYTSISPWQKPLWHLILRGPRSR